MKPKNVAQGFSTVILFSSQILRLLVILDQNKHIAVAVLGTGLETDDR